MINYWKNDNQFNSLRDSIYIDKTFNIHLLVCFFSLKTLWLYCAPALLWFMGTLYHLRTAPKSSSPSICDTHITLCIKKQTTHQGHIPEIILYARNALPVHDEHLTCNYLNKPLTHIIYLFIFRKQSCDSWSTFLISSHSREIWSKSFKTSLSWLAAQLTNFCTVRKQVLKLNVYTSRFNFF